MEREREVIVSCQILVFVHHPNILDLSVKLQLVLVLIPTAHKCVELMVLVLITTIVHVLPDMDHLMIVNTHIVMVFLPTTHKFAMDQEDIVMLLMIVNHILLNVLESYSMIQLFAALKECAWIGTSVLAMLRDMVTFANIGSALVTLSMPPILAVEMVTVQMLTNVHANQAGMEVIVPFQCVMEFWQILHRFVTIEMVLVQFQEIVHVIRDIQEQIVLFQFVMEPWQPIAQFVLEELSVSEIILVLVILQFMVEASAKSIDVMELYPQMQQFVIIRMVHVQL